MKTVQKSRQGKFSRTFTDCTSFICFTILACEIALSTNQILDITKIGKLNSFRLNTCLVILLQMIRYDEYYIYYFIHFYVINFIKFLLFIILLVDILILSCTQCIVDIR